MISMIDLIQGVWSTVPASSDYFWFGVRGDNSSNTGRWVNGTWYRIPSSRESRVTLTHHPMSVEYRSFYPNASAAPKGAP